MYAPVRVLSLPLHATQGAWQCSRASSSRLLNSSFQQRRSAKSYAPKTPMVKSATRAPDTNKAVDIQRYNASLQLRIQQLPTRIRSWCQSYGQIPTRDVDLIIKYAQVFLKSMPSYRTLNTSKWHATIRGLGPIPTVDDVEIKHIRWCAIILQNIFGYSEYFHRIPEQLVAWGDIEMLAMLLESHMQAKKRWTPLALKARQKLQDLLLRNDDSLFELQVLEARLLTVEGKRDDAIKLLEKSVPAARAAVEQQLSSKFAYPWYRPLPDPFELMSPWSYLVSLYLDKVKETATQDRGALRERIARAIDAGVAGDSAIPHWFAAERALDEHNAHEHAGYIDEESGLEREARALNDIGTPSAWLYHMTKAAASGLPDACAKLGQFYWSTPWPFLDDEPAAATKPTPVDRYPQSPLFITRLRRVAQALGVLAIPAGPEDMFRVVASPQSLHARLNLAKSWLDCADNLRYAPALQTLIEMHATEEIPSDIATPAEAAHFARTRYRYSSKEALFDSIFDGTYDQKREVKMVTNPLYNEEHAKKYIARAFSALEALRTFQEYKRTISETEGDNYKRQLKQYFQEHSPELYKGSESMQWIAFQEVFELWQDDLVACQGLNTYIRTLCKDRHWTIYNDQNRLVHKPK